ncbi:MAG: hydroxyethylthiazole kinase [Pseudozobellia sp.]|nr:hydroxyethylthiazole kinase [Pseudozobellia sp.]|tara:strand:+ start:110253 stop:111053 length:801 start_codon:yes stop_codon:yes gene_type:complete
MDSTTLWNHIESIREKSPLVHNIANFVVMNNTANALLATGASPIMAHAHSEIPEMVNICRASVINIGTLDEYWQHSMFLAADKASSLGKPFVVDPVGAGATSFRDQTLSELLKYRPTVVRGNASEIMALAKLNTTPTKGVDSTAESNEAIEAGLNINEAFGSVVCISGKTDIVLDGKKKVFLKNGHELMTKVTGLGCSATAIIGAFIAVIDNKLEAVSAAMSLLAVAGELAAENANGPGSLQMHLLDKLHNLTAEEFSSLLKFSVE